MQLREHLTGDEVLMHGRDWIVLKAQKTSERTRTGMARAKNPRASDPALGGPGEPLDKIPRACTHLTAGCGRTAIGGDAAGCCTEHNA